MPAGIESLINGSYTPRHLKRHYFDDETVDQLHISDRILQHILLKQLKPTFKHVISPNVYHLSGPTGVRHATKRIRQILQEENPQYVLRTDIRSYYRSIKHFKLLRDIKEYYDDPKILAMFEQIIKNPIETLNGYQNPDTGIALRGPLSQFLSAIFLKKLDDAFDKMRVSYLRYQDDILVLCKTKRQLNRCKRRMMEVLRERGLSLSRKKSQIGPITKGFNFLGVHYLPTRTKDSITITHAKNDEIINLDVGSVLSISGGGEPTSVHLQHEPMRTVPHPRTIRKAREQVKIMVIEGFLPKRIKKYLHHWLMWWVNTSKHWRYEELLHYYLRSCWDPQFKRAAHELLRDFNLAPDAIAGQAAA